MGNQLEARALTLDEQRLLRKIVRALNASDATALESQIDAARVTGGLPTLLDLTVERAAPPAGLDDGPLPVRAIVSEPCGEVLVWVKDGLLDGLEFAWASAEAPTEMPGPDRVSVEP